MDVLTQIIVGVGLLAILGFSAGLLGPLDKPARIVFTGELLACCWILATAELNLLDTALVGGESNVTSVIKAALAIGMCIAFLMTTRQIIASKE